MYSRMFTTNIVQRLKSQRLKSQRPLLHRMVTTNKRPNAGYGGQGSSPGPGPGPGPDWESIFVMLVGSYVLYSIVHR
jgi:hypothetical protein